MRSTRPTPLLTPTRHDKLVFLISVEQPMDTAMFLPSWKHVKNLKSIQDVDALAPRQFTGIFPNELVLEVSRFSYDPQICQVIYEHLLKQTMKYCSPYDLLQLRFSCREYRQMLDHCPSLWVHAYWAFEDLIPPPPEHISCPGNWSAAAYTQFLFGGGACDVCATSFVAKLTVTKHTICRTVALKQTFRQCHLFFDSEDAR
jgi:hypothetical protein